MKHALPPARICALAAAPAALAALLCAATPAHAISGVVAGNGYYAGATVCIDRNANGRCDPNEPHAMTDANGAFTLPGDGAVVAQIPAGASLRDAGSGAATSVARALTLRAPRALGAVVSPVSTELQALAEANGGDIAAALADLRQRMDADVLADPNQQTGAARARLMSENEQLLDRIANAVAEAGRSGNLVKTLRNRLALDAITNVVFIYAENRSFDNLFGTFPGANGLNSAAARAIQQVDRDGHSVLAKLPPAWGGLTAAGQTPAITQAQTTNVWPNAPFQIDAPKNPFGYGTVTQGTITRDLYHRFFENAMQINGGASNQYAAWGDSGGLVMGWFDGSKMKLWGLAKQYTLADNFFQGAYGGSFLNHQYLVCACVPAVPPATVTSNKMSLNVLGEPVNGVPQLAANANGSTTAPGAVASALAAPPSLKTGNIAPLDYFGKGDGYRAVNTMQPPFQPSGNKPASHDGDDPLYSNPTAGTWLPPQTQPNIGDLLSARDIGWAWYAGGWAAAAANPYPYANGAYGASSTIYNANGSGTADASGTDFQAHHQPFNYFANMDPLANGTARKAHLKDRADLLVDARAGKLPPVAFYKPVGYQNEHPGYTNVTDGDQEFATVVKALQDSPQWKHMLIVITYDEFGGQFDHVAPPKGDLMGPGTRIPAVFISPFVKKGYVDHTQYDTASVLRFITHRYSLPVLHGLQVRDDTLQANGGMVMGDFTNALDFDAAARPRKAAKK